MVATIEKSGHDVRGQARVPAGSSKGGQWTRLGGSAKQVQWAEAIRQKLLGQVEHPEAHDWLGQQPQASWWIDRRDLDPESLVREHDTATGGARARQEWLDSITDPTAKGLALKLAAVEDELASTGGRYADAAARKRRDELTTEQKRLSRAVRDAEERAGRKDTYTIPVENYPRLALGIEKLAARSKKLGMPPIGLRIVSTQRHEDKHEDGSVTRWSTREVAITGEAPHVKGWTFAATLQHASEVGNLIEAVPGQKIPEKFRTAAATWCDHCRQSRHRITSYLLHNAQGEWKQVGSNCLKDFLGVENPHDLARYAEYLAQAGDLAGDEEEKNFYDGPGRRERLQSIDTLLAYVAESIKRDGWVSRSAARADGTGRTRATVDAALDMIARNAKGGKDDWRDRDPRWTPSEESDAEAKDALAWARDKTAADEGLDDYWWNVKIAVAPDHVQPKAVGVAGSVVASYQRNQNRLAQDEAKRKARATGADGVSRHVGEVGLPLKFTATVTGEKQIDSDYGAFTLVTLTTPEGNVLKWRDRSGSGLEMGKTYRLVGKVKEHGEWQGDAETTVTHVKPDSTAAEKKAYAVDVARLAVAEAALAPLRQKVQEALTAGRAGFSGRKRAEQGSDHYNYSAVSGDFESAPEFADWRQAQAEYEAANEALGPQRLRVLTGLTGEVVEGQAEVAPEVPEAPAPKKVPAARKSPERKAREAKAKELTAALKEATRRNTYGTAATEARQALDDHTFASALLDLDDTSKASDHEKALEAAEAVMRAGGKERGWNYSKMRDAGTWAAADARHQAENAAIDRIQKAVALVRPQIAVEKSGGTADPAILAQAREALAVVPTAWAYPAPTPEWEAGRATIIAKRDALKAEHSRLNEITQGHYQAYQRANYKQDGPEHIAYKAAQGVSQVPYEGWNRADKELREYEATLPLEVR